MGSYIPLKQKEVTWLQLLWGCREIIEGDCEMEQRLKSCRKWRLYRTIRSWIGPITDALMGTIEPSKARQFAANITNHELRVCTKGSINTTHNMIVMDEDVASRFVVRNVKDRCLLCDGSNAERAKCQLRRDLKHQIMFEIDETTNCIGRELAWRVKDD